ncbi:MAG: TetR/AcrR family transcriptional regulator [Bacillota bacterium]
MVNQSFNRLQPEKRELILRSCLEEFVKKGYHRASTAIIAQKAGISKGALFYYFNNKKGLYLYLIEHTRNILEEKFRREINSVKEAGKTTFQS